MTSSSELAPRTIAVPRRRAGLSAAALGALLLSACGSDDANVPATGDSGAQTVTVPLQLTEAGCDGTAIGLLRALDVELTGAATKTSACVAAQPKTLSAIQQALKGQADLRDVPPGSVVLKVRGYLDQACTTEQMVLCGAASFSLPADSTPVAIPLSCWGGPAALAFDQCANADSGRLDVSLSQQGCAGSGEVDRVQSARVRWQGPAGPGESACVAISRTTAFADLQRQLTPHLQLQGLSAGQTTVTVWGFEDPSCRTDKVTLCGNVSLLLPGPAATIPTSCSGDPAFASCPSP